MDYIQILQWDHEEGTSFYDASTPELLHAAALHILDTRYEEGIFSKPRPLAQNHAYLNYKKSQESLLIALNGNTSEAFAHLHFKLNQINRYIANTEKAFERNQERYDNIMKALSKRDGELAFSVLIGIEDFELIQVARVQEVEHAEA